MRNVPEEDTQRRQSGEPVRRRSVFTQCEIPACLDQPSEQRAIRVMPVLLQLFLSSAVTWPYSRAILGEITRERVKAGVRGAMRRKEAECKGT